MSTTSQIADALEKSGIPFSRVAGVADGIEYWGLTVIHENIHAEVRECSDWVEMKVWHYTPEQFMNMLVGVGTCHIEERHGDWYCTGCGEMVGTCDTASELCIDGNAIELWVHCPNCGKRIVSD